MGQIPCSTERISCLCITPNYVTIWLSISWCKFFEYINKAYIKYCYGICCLLCCQNVTINTLSRSWSGSRTNIFSEGSAVMTPLFICPIAIAYSIGQIIKPVFLCPCVHLRALSCSHFLMDFHQNWHRCKTSKVKRSSLAVNITPPVPPFCLKTSILGEEVLKIHANTIIIIRRTL